MTNFDYYENMLEFIGMLYCPLTKMFISQTYCTSRASRVVTTVWALSTVTVLHLVFFTVGVFALWLQIYICILSIFHKYHVNFIYNVLKIMISPIAYLVQLFVTQNK